MQVRKSAPPPEATSLAFYTWRQPREIRAPRYRPAPLRPTPPRDEMFPGINQRSPGLVPIGIFTILTAFPAIWLKMCDGCGVHRVVQSAGVKLTAETQAGGLLTATTVMEDGLQVLCFEDIIVDKSQVEGSVSVNLSLLLENRRNMEMPSSPSLSLIHPVSRTHTSAPTINSSLCGLGACPGMWSRHQVVSPLSLPFRAAIECQSVLS